MPVNYQLVPKVDKVDSSKFTRSIKDSINTTAPPRSNKTPKRGLEVKQLSGTDSWPHLVLFSPLVSEEFADESSMYDEPPSLLKLSATRGSITTIWKESRSDLGQLTSLRKVGGSIPRRVQRCCKVVFSWRSGRSCARVSE